MRLGDGDHVGPAGREHACAAPATLETVVAQLAGALDVGITEAFVDLHYLADDVEHALNLAGELWDLTHSDSPGSLR